MATFEEKLVSLFDQLDVARASNDTAGLLQAARAISALEKEVEKAEREAAAGKADEAKTTIEKDLRKLVEKHRGLIGEAQITLIQWRTLEPSGDGWLVKSKATRSGGGGGGGGAGKTKEVYGHSLDEVFQAFATPEDIADFEAAKGDGNKTYAVKVVVKKRAIADGQLMPKA